MLFFEKKYLEEAINWLDCDNKEWCNLIKEASFTAAEREEQLYDEYTREADASNFVNALQRAKLMVGIISVRITTCVTKIRETTPTTIRISEQPSRVKLPQ